MSIIVNNILFEGPYSNADKLKCQSGIYLIICRRGNRNSIIDVGESDNIKMKIETCNHKEIWAKYSKCGTLTIAIHYTPNLHQSDRIKVQEKIKNNYNIV